MGILGALELAVSAFVYEETEERLAEKWPAGLAFFFELKRTIGTGLDLPPESLVREALDILDDPDDAPVVGGAVHAGARYLATYDRRHLLRKRDEIAGRFGIDVATPEEILAALGFCG